MTRETISTKRAFSSSVNPSKARSLTAFASLIAGS